MTTQLFISEREAKRDIIQLGKRMYEKSLVAASDGNISCKIAEDIILVTPTGISKGSMTEDMLVRIRLDGTVMSSGPYAPSSETKLHLSIYQENPAVGGVIHAHPPASTALAICGTSLDEALYLAAIVNLGVVPCVPYETPGSQALADSIRPYCMKYHAVLLANHGTLTWGASLLEAFYRLETLEHYAKILSYIDRSTTKLQTLTGEQVEELLKLRSNHGAALMEPYAGTSASDSSEDLLPGRYFAQPSGE